MLDDLVEMLDRRWNQLNAAEDIDFFINLFAFHQQLIRDSRTASILRDLRSDEQRSAGELATAKDEILAEVTATLDALEAGARSAFGPEPYDMDDEYVSPAGLRRRLNATRTKTPEAYTVGKERDFDNVLSSVIDALSEVAIRAKLRDAENLLVSCKLRLEHMYRARRVFWATSGASSLVIVERHLADAHPPATKLEPDAARARFSRMRGSPLGSVVETIFGVGSSLAEDDPSVEAFLAGVRDDARRVYEEVRRRIGAERSLLAVFDRYRQRCQWYEAPRLRTLAEDNPGKAEDRLVETLATYLFDQGLNPLTQPLAGLIRPDLLGPDSRFSFYVEGKQYAEPARAYLRDGIQQVWDMLHQLHGSNFDVREAFYIVYRLAGPQYVFPPRLQHGDRVVHILLIDIAPPSVRGSRATTPEAFTEAELLPREAIGESS